MSPRSVRRHLLSRRPRNVEYYHVLVTALFPGWIPSAIGLTALPVNSVPTLALEGMSWLENVQLSMTRPITTFSASL
jgi:hypothetical protein